jgi:hypothetical protein
MNRSYSGSSPPPETLSRHKQRSLNLHFIFFSFLYLLHKTMVDTLGNFFHPFRNTVCRFYVFIYAPLRLQPVTLILYRLLKIPNTESSSSRQCCGCGVDLGGAIIKLPPGAGAVIRIRLQIATILSKTLNKKSYRKKLWLHQST